MEIPWWTWLLVGVLVVAISLFTELTVFVFVGAVFLIVASAKLVTLFVLRPRPVGVVSEKEVCPRCQLSVEKGDFFCRLCGKQLRST